MIVLSLILIENLKIGQEKLFFYLQKLGIGSDIQKSFPYEKEFIRQYYIIKEKQEEKLGEQIFYYTIGPRVVHEMGITPVLSHLGSVLGEELDPILVKDITNRLVKSDPVVN